MHGPCQFVIHLSKKLDLLKFILRCIVKLLPKFQTCSKNRLVYAIWTQFCARYFPALELCALFSFWEPRFTTFANRKPDHETL